MDLSGELKDELPEVTEADIYVDFAEADDDAGGPVRPSYSSLSSSTPSRLSYPALSSRLSLPLEAGEQSIRLPLEVGSNHVSGPPLSSSSGPKPSTTLPVSSSSGLPQVLGSSLPKTLRPTPRGVFSGEAHSGSPVLPHVTTGGPRPNVDHEDDEDEDVDVDTPYDGRLLIQSSSRPNQLLSMLAKTLPVARKSTSKGSLSKGGSSKTASKSKTVARKSTGGLNKMIPKVLQIAKKSTAKQRNRSKVFAVQETAMPNTLTVNESRQTTPTGTRTILLDHSSSRPTPGVSAKSVPLPARSSPKARNLHLPAAPQPSPPKQKAQPSPKQRQPASKPAPKSKKQPPSISAGPSEQATVQSNSSSPSSLSYRATQKTAYRKGFEQTPPFTAAQKRRRASGAGYESSASETSEASASKQAKLQEAESELDATMKLLNEKRELLRSVEEQLASVTASLQTMVENKEKLEAHEAKVSVHLVSLETAARPFDCGICTEAFQLALSCPRAFRQHGKHKPFQCKHCPAAFTHHRLLEKHIDWHISDRAAFSRASHTAVPAVEDSSEMESESGRSPAPGVRTRLSLSESERMLKQEAPPSQASAQKPTVPSVTSENKKTPAADKKKASQEEQKTPEKQKTPVDTQKAGNVAQTVSDQKSKKTRAFCHMCGKQFEYYCYLAKHMKVHTSIYTCSYCTKCFTVKSAIIEHTAKEHKDKNLRVTCKFCRKQFSSLSDLERHIPVHLRGERNECPVCGKRYNWSKNVVKHMQDAHREQHSGSALKNMLTTGDFQCFKCGKSFMQPTSLVQHDQTFHADTGKAEEEQDTDHMDPKDSRQSAARQSSKEQTPQPGLSSGSKGVEKPKKSASGSVVNNLRNKALVSRQKIASQLTAHAKKRAQAKGKISCQLCASSFTCKIGLRKHIRKFHPDAYTTTRAGHRNMGSYKCTYCGLMFIMYKRLLLHVATNHPGLQPPDKQPLSAKSSRLQKSSHLHAPRKCPKCGIVFSDPRKFWEHVRTAHPVQKVLDSFKCGLCPKRYTNRKSIYKHSRAVHSSVALDQPVNSQASTGAALAQPSPNPQPPQTAPSKTAKKKSGLKMRSGGEHRKCPVCSRAVSRKNYYQHIRYHHPDVPCFKCSKCGAGFKYSKDYSEHQCGQPETVEDCRYRCLTCGAGFHIAREWTRHMQEHGVESEIAVDSMVKMDGAVSNAGSVTLPTTITIKTEYMFRCVDCGDTFDDEEVWGQHICVVEGSSFSQVEEDSSTEKSFSLKDASDSSEPSAQETISTSSGSATCTVCLRTLSVNSLRKHYKNLHHMKYKECRQCQLGFANMTVYNKHVAEHQNNSLTTGGSRTVRCAVQEISGNQEPEESLTDKNWQVTMSEQPDGTCRSPLLLKIKAEPASLPKCQDSAPVQCTVCSRTFSPLYIRKHMRKVHSLHALKCKKCGENFVDQLLFSRHMLEHREEELLTNYKLTASGSGLSSPAAGEDDPRSPEDVSPQAVSAAEQQAVSITASALQYPVVSDTQMEDALAGEPSAEEAGERAVGSSAVDPEEQELEQQTASDPEMAPQNPENAEHRASSGPAEVSEAEEYKARDPATALPDIESADRIPSSPLAESADPDLKHTVGDAAAVVPSDMEVEEHAEAVEGPAEPEADRSDVDLAEEMASSPAENHEHTFEHEPALLGFGLAEEMMSSPTVYPSVLDGFAGEPEAVLSDAENPEPEEMSSSPRTRDHLSEVDELATEESGVVLSDLDLPEEMASLPTADYEADAEGQIDDDLEIALLPSNAELPEDMACSPVISLSEREPEDEVPDGEASFLSSEPVGDQAEPVFGEDIVGNPDAVLSDLELIEQMNGSPTAGLAEFESNTVNGPNTAQSPAGANDKHVSGHSHYEMTEFKYV